MGSTRPAKVEAARAAIDAIAVVNERFRRTILKPVDVSNVAPTMPMTERAILDGARIRARTLIDRALTAGRAEFPLAIGVEGGLDPLPGDGARYALMKGSRRARRAHIDTLSVLAPLIECGRCSVPIRQSRARPRPVESG